MYNVERTNGREQEYVNRYEMAKEYFINNPGDSLRSIADKFGIDRWGFAQNLKKQGFNAYPNRKNKNLNHSIFETIDTEEKAYWLGFLYADGYVSASKHSIELALKESDLEHIMKFKEFIGTDNKVSKREPRLNNKTYSAYRLSFNSKKIKEDLIKNGCTPNKSLTLEFPSDEIVPPHLKRHFARGYIDGDGSLIFTEKTKALELIGTEWFIVDFCNYFGLKVNTLSGVGESKKNKRWHTYNRTALPSILDMFYDECNIYLQRKYDIYLKFKNAVYGGNTIKYDRAKSVKAE